MLLQKHAGLVDSPLLSQFDLRAVLAQWQVRPASQQALMALGAHERQRSVVIVQDTFTRYFDPEPLAALIELAARLGYQVWLAPLNPNGKPLHVQGFLGAFAKAAVHNARQLAELAHCGVPLVGLDPAMTLTYRQEYRKVEGIGTVPQVALPQEWLLEALPPRPSAPAPDGPAYTLMPHCTESTNAPGSASQWTQVFERSGLRLRLESVGCCGMSGTYGHEQRNLETSRQIYAQSWARKLPSGEASQQMLATGYSCRSQVRRLSDQRLRHPVQALLEHLRAAG